MQAALSPQRDLINHQSDSILPSRSFRPIGFGVGESGQIYGSQPSVFISYASPDRRYVERLLYFLEAQRFKCWVSYRDIRTGENYQAAITQALRCAKVLVVIFTDNANLSVEIPKELSLASRYGLQVLPVRMELAEPGDALAYKVATRQWLDAFGSWSVTCDRLLSQLAAIMPTQVRSVSVPRPALAPRRPGGAAATAEGARFISPRGPRTLGKPALVCDAKPADGPAGGNQVHESWLIEAVKFLIVVLGAASCLYDYFLQGELPLFGFAVWVILLICYAHLVGLILWGFVAVSQTNRAVRNACPPD